MLKYPDPGVLDYPPISIPSKFLRKPLGLRHRILFEFLVGYFRAANTPECAKTILPETQSFLRNPGRALYPVLLAFQIIAEFIRPCQVHEIKVHMNFL